MTIQLDDIVKKFDSKQVLKGVSLQIEEGQFVALLGPSGCGKTTLLNAIAGLTDLDGGSVRVGKDIWSAKGYSLPPEKRNVGMVFQDFALWPHLSVYENVAFGLKIKKLPSEQIKGRVFEVLDMVQMAEYAKQLPHQLSGGQKQRVAIARALAPRPTVMLMDEPLSSLDAKLREQMRWDLLSVIRKAGTTTIYVTHDQVEALSMADYVVLMNNGKIDQMGSPTHIYQSPVSTFAATFVGASNLLTGEVVQNSDEGIVVNCDGHFLSAQSRASMGEAVTLMVRPSDITMVADQESTSRTEMGGEIVQRAFHGVIWQYRVKIRGWNRAPLEVWDAVEHRVGCQVGLTISSSHCRVVAETRLGVEVYAGVL